MLKTFDVTHFRRYVTPPDNTSKQIRRFAFSVIDVYKVKEAVGFAQKVHFAVLLSLQFAPSITFYRGWFDARH